MKFKKEISNKLNELLVKNIDAEKCYSNAIDNIGDGRLKMLFKRRVTDRGEFAKELRAEILSYGEIPEDTGSLKETFNRNWTSLKLSLTSNNEEAVLGEAIKFEETVLDDYNELLKDNVLPPTIDGIKSKIWVFTILRI